MARLVVLLVVANAVVGTTLFSVVVVLPTICAVFAVVAASIRL
jgi:hypothetical protein